MKPLTSDELDVLARMAAIDIPIAAVQVGKRAELLPVLERKRAVVSTSAGQWALTRFGKWHGERHLKTLDGSNDQFWVETRLSTR